MKEGTELKENDRDTRLVSTQLRLICDETAFRLMDDVI